MNIQIHIMEKKLKNNKDGFMAKGEIQIDDHKEGLLISLDWWSLDDYKHQWQEGLNRLVNHDTSCLVVSINNPKIRRYIEWWVLYKIDHKVYIQNHIITGDIYKQQIGDRVFTMETCYNFIPERGNEFDEDGNRISEWVVDL